MTVFCRATVAHLKASNRTKNPVGESSPRSAVCSPVAGIVVDRDPLAQHEWNFKEEVYQIVGSQAGVSSFVHLVVVVVAIRYFDLE
jgi:hypothetical protein